MEQYNTGRILKELRDFQKIEDFPNFVVVPIGDNVSHWKGLICGAKDTCYQDGVFQIDIQLPPDYPYKPPKMRFDTKIWHPNISSTSGAISLDILKPEWSPALSIRTALLSLQVLMVELNPHQPQDVVVADQCKSDKAKFYATAKAWTEKYANWKEKEEMIDYFTELGFQEKGVIKVLLMTNWDKEKALEHLF